MLGSCNSFSIINYRESFQTPMVRTGITKTSQKPQVMVPYPLAMRSINPNWAIKDAATSKATATAGLMNDGIVFPFSVKTPATLSLKRG